ncbi:MAG: hypothetical protein ACKVOO_12385 [Burkholderiaceae bacterium]
MSLQVVLQNLSTRIATECKALRTLINGNAADLSSLTTTAKGNLVVAINEVRALATSAGSINDASTTTASTWSSQQINDYVASQVSTILGGAGAAYDTLLEIQQALQADDSDIAAIMTALGNRVRFDAVQTLTAPQQAQACANIGVGDPETNFVTTFNAGLV